MKKSIFLPIFCILLYNNLLFSGSIFSSDKNKPDWLLNRLDSSFNLKKICEEHSQEALKIYQLSKDEFKDLESKIPDEVLERLKYQRDYNFDGLGPKPASLFHICAQKIALRALELTDKPSLVYFFRDIEYIKKHTNVYDPELAKLIINLHFDEDFEPSKELLDTCLYTATYLGDCYSVEVLIGLGANCNFVNKYHHNYSPFTLLLKIETENRKIIDLDEYRKRLMTRYMYIAQQLIKGGAKVDHLMNQQGIAYIVTGDSYIFELFEDQIKDKINTSDTIGYNLFINALRGGSVNLIMKLYNDPVYKDATSAFLNLQGVNSFMDLAMLHFKGNNFKKLYEFLRENDEKPNLKPCYNANEFGAICLNNALFSFDYAWARNLAMIGVPLKTIYNDNSTLLINVIKYAPHCTDNTALINIINLLGIYHVNFFQRDHLGKTALDYAQSLGLNDKVIQALIITPLIYKLVVNKEDKEDLLELICKIKNENGIEIFSYKDPRGKTALDYAEEFSKDCSVIEILRSYTIQNFE